MLLRMPFCVGRGERTSLAEQKHISSRLLELSKRWQYQLLLLHDDCQPEPAVAFLQVGYVRPVTPFDASTSVLEILTRC
jgi:hypothetical protein